MFPVTVHVKAKVSPGQRRGAAVNCPATLPAYKYSHQGLYHYLPVCTSSPRKYVVLSKLGMFLKFFRKCRWAHAHVGCTHPDFVDFNEILNIFKDRNIRFSYNTLSL